MDSNKRHFSTPHVSTQHWTTIFFLFFLGALGVVLFWSGLATIFSRWAAQPEYSHGYLIPIVSIYIVWERREEVIPYLNSGSWWGIPICVLSIIILTVGEISALFLIIHYAFLIFLLALSVVLIGRGTHLTLVPISILIFAIPLPYIIEVLLTSKMQLLSSSVGVAIIRFFDIPVYLSGNIIDMGEFKLHVVEACSGLRYLFPLTCIGFLAAYFYSAPWWKKTIIFVSTIPITIIMNSVRIALTGVLVENYGTEIAQGFLHDFEGWVVFIICMTILLVEIVVLEQLGNKRKLAMVFSLQQEGQGEKNQTHITILSKKNSLVQKSFFAMLLVCATIMLTFIDKREEHKINNTSFASFPLQLEQWQGRRQPLSKDIVDELQITDYLMVNYKESHANHTDKGEQVNFYVAYYDSQRKGVSPHSPKVCIPGGGWEIAEFNRTVVNNMPVNRALIRKGNESQLVYYWFVERGEVVANEYLKKWMLLRDAFKKNRTDGSLVRVVTPVLKHENIAESEARVAAFIAIAQPQLIRYLPGKTI